MRTTYQLSTVHGMPLAADSILRAWENFGPKTTE
jgi:hypothetical protein